MPDDRASSDLPDRRALVWTELQRMREVSSAIRSDLRFAERKLEQRDHELSEARAAYAELNRAQADLSTRLEAAEIDRHRVLEAEQDLRRQLADLRADLTQTQQQYQELQEHRAVGLALAVAESLRPASRLVRRLRRVTHVPAPRPGPQVAPAPRLDPAERAAITAVVLPELIAGQLPPPPLGSGPRVTAIILNRSGEHHLRRLLPALAATAYDNLEVVVIDNASEDGSLAYLDGLQPPFPLTVIRNQDNRSFSAANNQGVAASDGDNNQGVAASDGDNNQGVAASEGDNNQGVAASEGDNNQGIPASEGDNNQGIPASEGDLVLLLNNDVEPMDVGWLARMVHTLLQTGAAAVGARLVYPQRPGLDNVGDTVHPDLTLQHRGIHFAHGPDGMPLPRNLGSGEDPLSMAAAATQEVAAATAACLLVRRDVLQTVGGLDPGYVYGTEDVDLCLKLRRAGHRIVYAGQAVLWHHEFGTQNVEGRDFKAENRRRNRLHFIDRWGPQLFREVLADRLRDTGQWSREPLRVGLLDATVDLDSLGWEVTHLPGSGHADPRLDLVVIGDPTADPAALPAHLIRIGWIGEDLDAWLKQAWFDDLDVVLVPGETEAKDVIRRSAKTAIIRPAVVSPAGLLRDALFGWCQSTRAAILISTPSRDVAEVWGDTHFARAMQRQLERRGIPTRVVFRPDFDAPWVAQADVVLHLLGLTEHRPRPAQINVLWNISHPEFVTPELVERYDLALIASDRFAAELARTARVPVAALHQATDHERFAPDPTGPHHQVLFVANSRRTRRHVVDDLTPTRRDLAIYGGDWFPELVDPGHVRGEAVANVDLPGYYTGADINLNDHWPEMREHEFISNRLYDVLAAGGFAISDPLEGLDTEFEGGVVTYRDREDLAAKVDRYLANPKARGGRVAVGRRAVLRRHTFAHRADALLGLLAPLLAAYRPGVAAEAPLLAAYRPGVAAEVDELERDAG